MNQRGVSKSGTKKGTSKGGSKPTGSKTALKSASIRGSNGYTRRAGTGPQSRPKPNLFFSYKSADDKNVLAIIDAVRTGISFNDFDKIVGNTPFSLAEWASYLQLSERTIQRNQKEKKAFQPIQSEKIVALAMLYEYGTEVFGDKDAFNTWLTSKSIALGGRAPKELLDTKFGIDMVKDELGRIEHGVLA